MNFSLGAKEGWRVPALEAKKQRTWFTARKEGSRGRGKGDGQGVFPIAACPWAAGRTPPLTIHFSLLTSALGAPVLETTRGLVPAGEISSMS